MTDLDIGMNQRLCKPFVWDDARDYDRGKVMTASRARSRQGLRPLQGRGRRRHSVAHAARHAPDQGRFLHARHHARSLCALLRARPGLHLQHGAAAAQVRDRGRPGAAAGGAQRRARRRALGVIYFGSTSPAMQRGAGRAGGRGRPRGRDAAARLPVPGVGRPVHRGAREGVRGRAEPRRADALHAGQRAGHRSRRGWCGCCTTTAPRSPPASSPTRSGKTSQDAIPRAAGKPRRKETV